jgi:hypothetical protein
VAKGANSPRHSHTKISPHESLTSLDSLCALTVQALIAPSQRSPLPFHPHSKRNAPRRSSY